jgi:hypothetical protein
MGIIVIWGNAFNLFSGFFGTKLLKKSTYGSQGTQFVTMVLKAGTEHSPP